MPGRMTPSGSSSSASTGYDVLIGSLHPALVGHGFDFAIALVGKLLGEALRSFSGESSSIVDSNVSPRERVDLDFNHLPLAAQNPSPIDR